MDKKYIDQVHLLLNILPETLSDSRLALKGGTAINLFYQNLPRLSVDIDLTYLPIEPREKTFNNLHTILSEIKCRIEKNLNMEVRYTREPKGTNQPKLLISGTGFEIKVEPNFIIRGSVFDAEQKSLCSAAAAMFKKEITVNCLSLADLYGGKICAALDRQHPRDLFDVRMLLNKNQFNSEIKDAFIFYLISGKRPFHELLQPNKLDNEKSYSHEFKGMLNEEVTLEDLQGALDNLIEKVRTSLTENDKMFLLSVAQNQPNWDFYAYPKVKEYPSIMWKMKNFSNMDGGKRDKQAKLLESILKGP